MKCPKCGGETNLTAEESSHDKEIIEVAETCEDQDKCGWYRYAFLKRSDFVSNQD